MVNKNSGSLRRDLFFDEDHKISRGEQSQLLCNIMKIMRQLSVWHFQFEDEFDYSPEGTRIRERRVSSCI